MFHQLFFYLICGYLSCCQSWMRLQRDFHYWCLAYVLLCLWEEAGLNGGTDLCQRLRCPGSEVDTHTHTALFFCCKRLTLRIEFLWECVIGLVFPRRQCCHRDTICAHAGIKLNAVLAAARYLIQPLISNLANFLLHSLTSRRVGFCICVYWLAALGENQLTNRPTRNLNSYDFKQRTETLFLSTWICSATIRAKKL